MIVTKLKEIAQKLNKNISEIAQETNINRNTITAIFHNKIDGIKFETIEKICKTYNIDINDLLEIKQEGTADPSHIAWYRQEGAIVPFTIWPVLTAISEYKYLLNHSLLSFGEGYCFFQKNYGWLYWDSATLTKLARQILGEYGTDEITAQKYFEEYVHASKDLEQAYYSNDPEHTLRMSDQELLDHLSLINKHYRKFWEKSLFIDTFDPEVDHEIISQITHLYNFSPDEITILTTPTKMTFTNERLLSFLYIVQKIKKEIKGKVTNDVVKDIILKDKDVATYILNFDYYKSNYSNTYHITIDEVVTEAIDYLQNQEKLDGDLDRLSNYTNNQESAVRKILKKYRIEKNPLFFISLLTYWREHRKKINLMGFHILDSILTAIENKTGIQKKYLRLMTFDEVGSVLRGTLSGNMLKERYDNGLLVHLYENGYRLIHGDEAASIRADLNKSATETNIEAKEMRGRTACQGYARGPARIVLDESDFHTFKQGEILITGMTRPEFVPLMKIAAGIITNEGGITCHAAIVSRELNKPCIIGTKNATEIIKNGDIVEVRANHGTVKIIRG